MIGAQDLLVFSKGMPPIINAQQISKTYGIAPLFQKISFTVSEGDRIGLIGRTRTRVPTFGGRIRVGMEGPDHHGTRNNRRPTQFEDIH